MELIKIYQNNLVNARELKELLQVKTDFSTWAKRMIDLGFKEGRDYIVVRKKEKKHVIIDYMLKISTAKEICMVQRNEMGKKAREYFIQCEEALKELKENKRLEAFTKLEVTKEKFKNILFEKGLEVEDYIQVDVEGRKVLLNGKVLEDSMIDLVLLKARDLAIVTTHHNVLKNNLSKVKEVTDENVKTHSDMREYLLNSGITPEDLPQKKDIKKLKE